MNLDARFDDTTTHDSRNNYTSIPSYLAQMRKMTLKPYWSLIRTKVVPTPKFKSVSIYNQPLHAIFRSSQFQTNVTNDPKMTLISAKLKVPHAFVSSAPNVFESHNDRKITMNAVRSKVPMYVLLGSTNPKFYSVGCLSLHFFLQWPLRQTRLLVEQNSVEFGSRRLRWGQLTRKSRSIE